MPSPVGHGLLGLVCSSFWFRRGRDKPWCWAMFLLVFAACLPDIDLLWGLLAGGLNLYHRMGTHSFTFAFISSGLLWIVWKRIDEAVDLREWLFLLLAAGSHLLADWLSIDPAPPHGIMLFWPLSESYYISSSAIFPPLSKDSVADIFQWKNVRPVIMEGVYLLPLLARSAVGLLRAEKGARSP